MKRIFNTNNPLSMMLMFILPVGATFVTTMIIFTITSVIAPISALEIYTTNVGFTITVILYLFQQIQTAEWIEAKKNAEIERRSERVERIKKYNEYTKEKFSKPTSTITQDDVELWDKKADVEMEMSE
jgi:hypothetical protein